MSDSLALHVRRRSDNWPVCQQHPTDHVPEHSNYTARVLYKTKSIAEWSIHVHVHADSWVVQYTRTCRCLVAATTGEVGITLNYCPLHKRFDIECIYVVIKPDVVTIYDLPQIVIESMQLVLSTVKPPIGNPPMAEHTANTEQLPRYLILMAEHLCTGNCEQTFGSR